MKLSGLFVFLFGKILLQVYCCFSKLLLIFFIYTLNTSMISSVTQFWEKPLGLCILFWITGEGEILPDECFPQAVCSQGGVQTTSTPKKRLNKERGDRPAAELLFTMRPPLVLKWIRRWQASPSSTRRKPQMNCEAPNVCSSWDPYVVQVMKTYTCRRWPGKKGAPGALCRNHVLHFPGPGVSVQPHVTTPPVRQTADTNVITVTSLYAMWHWSESLGVQTHGPLFSRCTEAAATGKTPMSGQAARRLK